MSRYPFLEFAEEYLLTLEGVVSPHTVAVKRRRLRRMATDFRSYSDEGVVSTTSPKKFTVEDVRIHLSRRRSMCLSPAEYRHEVSTLSLLMDFVGNPSLRLCLQKYPGLKVPHEAGRLPSLDSDDISSIVHVLSQSRSGDPVRLRAYGMLALFLGAGLRSKELRLMRRNDLDPETMCVLVRHPKGEASYGVQRVVPIHPRCRQTLTEWLDFRDSEMDSVYLFPPFRSSGDFPLSQNSISSILRIALDDIGVDCDSRKLRRTFGQVLLDEGIDSIETVSVLMGHCSTRTTEKYYARRRNAAAVQAALNLWDEKKDGKVLEADSTVNPGQTIPFFLLFSGTSGHWQSLDCTFFTLHDNVVEASGDGCS